MINPFSGVHRLLCIVILDTSISTALGVIDIV